MFQTPEEIRDAEGRPITPADFGYGDMALPHAMQFAAIVSGADNVYWSARYDQAIKDSRTDAIAMLRDAFLVSLLWERIRAIACRKWHIEVDDEKDVEQAEVRDVITKALKLTSVGSQKECQGLIYLKVSLLLAVWFGRQAMQVKWRWDNVIIDEAAPNKETNPTELDHFTETHPEVPAGPDIRPKKTRRALVIGEHWPVQGDKITHTFDHTPVILLNTAKTTEIPGAEFLSTFLGYGLALKGTWRERFIIHNYHGQDVDFFQQLDEQEAIHGVGERSTIYWLNYERLEFESWYSTYFNRVGLGTNVWLYQGGNPEALAEAKSAALNHSNKNNIFVPVWPGMGNSAITGAFQRVEVPTAGAEALRSAIKHKEEKIERLLVGQSSSSRSESKGLGTHNNDFQMQTKADIAVMDGEMFDATMTRDCVAVMVRYTFWDKPHLWKCARYVTEVQSVDPQAMLEATGMAMDHGVQFIEDEVRGLIPGMSKPQAGDETVGGKETLDAANPPPFGGMPPGQNGKPSPNGKPPQPGQNGKPQPQNGRQNSQQFQRHDDTAPPTHTAESVLEMIKASPQFAHSHRDWGAYAKKWGIQGEFQDKMIPSQTLSRMIDEGALRIEPRLDWRAIRTKARLRDYNPVIVTNNPEGGLIVCDGNHSLIAAIENHEEEVKCIVPVSDSGNSHFSRESLCCPLCAGPMLAMAAGGYRCGSPPCEGLLEEPITFWRDANSQPHKFASTQFDLPEPLASKILAASKLIPDEELAEDGRESVPHVTIKYGLHTSDADTVREAVKGFGPISLRLGSISIFPANEARAQRSGEQYDVVKAEIVSPELHRLNKALCALPHTDAHPDYKPHATLAYVKPGFGKRYIDFVNLGNEVATVSDIVFSSKDGEKTTIRLPVAEVLQFSRWITIGGHPDPTQGTQHTGGTRIEVDDDGNILQGGPPEWKGRKITDVHKEHAKTEAAAQKNAETDQAIKTTALMENLKARAHDDPHAHNVVRELLDAGVPQEEIDRVRQQPQKESKAPAGWGDEGESSQQYTNPQSKMTDAQLKEAHARSPVPLPGHEGVEDKHLKAWDAVSRLWPEMAAKVTKIRQYDPSTIPEGVNAPNAFINPFTGALAVKPGANLDAETLWHEMVHLEQAAQGRLKPRMEMEPDEYNEREIEARQRGKDAKELLQRFESAKPQQTPTEPARNIQQLRQERQLGRTLEKIEDIWSDMPNEPTEHPSFEQLKDVIGVGGWSLQNKDKLSSILKFTTQLASDLSTQVKKEDSQEEADRQETIAGLRKMAQLANKALKKLTGE